MMSLNGCVPRILYLGEKTCTEFCIKTIMEELNLLHSTTYFHITFKSRKVNNFYSPSADGTMVSGFLRW
jgi:hypothetical protein